jgi:acyl transferase domain-containing protein/enoyl-CoA hydratase/carnithine racemase/acyl carrier protein
MSLISQDEDMKEAVGKWIARRKYGKLLELWAKGLDVDWQQLYGQVKPQRVSLPTYPFSQERYWVEVAPAIERPVKTRQLHPLVHENTSQFGEQSYTSWFDGHELSVPVYLEMARAAIALALPANGRELELQQTAWTNPAPVAGKHKVNIALQECADASIEFEIYSIQDDGEEVVYCQGRGVYGETAPVVSLNLSQLDGLTLKLEIDAPAPDYVLHPGLIDGALRACVNLMTAQNALQATMVCGIESVRALRPCPANAVAWARPSAISDMLDVDLSDSTGMVCIQMSGVRMMKIGTHQPVLVAPPQSVVLVPTVPVAAGKPRAIELPDPALATASVFSGAKAVPVRQPFVQLSVMVSEPSNVADQGNGIFAITLAADPAQAPQQLVSALTRVQAMPEAKVVLLRGTAEAFLRGEIGSLNEEIASGLFETLMSFPVPLVAVMQGDATGLGFLIGAVCDFMICATESKFGFDASAQSATSSQFALLAKRFGDFRALDLLHASGPISGQQLKARGFTMPVVPSHAVEEFACDLAKRLAEKPLHALQVLKRHLARDLPLLTAAQESAPQIAHEADLAYPCNHVQCDSMVLPASGRRVLVATLMTMEGAATASDMLIELCGLIEDLTARRSHACLILTSRWNGFLPADEVDLPLLMRLRGVLLAAPMPVIAILDTSTAGVALLLAQHCDSCVYNLDAVYGADVANLSGQYVPMAAATLAHRLGGMLANNLLFEAQTYTGAELRERQAALTVVPAAGEMAAALDLAATWVAVPTETLVLWRAPLGAAPSGVMIDVSEASAPKTGAVSLKSTVVSAVADAEGVLTVSMMDRDARNMFSPELVAGMEEVFAHIAATPSYKVVVLTGYDSYFASGGTKENLLAIQAGTVRFTDHTIFDLALRCEIPVIAAMQGHGIGAGWALGMFADFNLFSERGEYVSPYMNYGFTPGAGATLVFPERVGYDLARETMLTGQQYTGRMLRDRGMTLPVMPQDQVVPTALALARKIAQHSRALLVALKNQLAAGLRLRLEDTYRLELEMHERTFVGRSDTLERIRERFAGAADTVTAAAPAMRNAVSSDQVAEVQAGLQALLAQELQLSVEETGEDVQFIDMGLDSVSGVTWMRKINEQYGTSIDATRIYSHPTLKQLAVHVHQQLQAGDVSAAPASTPIAQAPAVSAVRSEDGDVQAGLKALLAQELQIAEDEIDDDTQFVDLGMDSVSGVTWMRRINEQYGTALDATKIYSHPTIRQLATQLSQELGDRAPAQKTAVVASKPILVEQPVPVKFAPAAAVPAVEAIKPLVSRRAKRSSRQDLSAVLRFEPIAVIGMAGQFPQAQDVEAFWQNIAAGKDCISEVPAGRWDIDAHYRAGEATPGKTNSRWMGALENYDCFDPLFFNISPAEAESMDPQQRLFLQTCWNAIEHAGYSADAFSGSKCGVFVGCAEGDYHQEFAAQRLSAQGFTGSASSILAARISYFLNLQGPCLAIDTACSSSLVAIANACDSLVNGNSDTALAGGVYVMAGPEMLIKTAQAGMLSADGRCFAFDQRANGFVPGEAVATVMLKRLSDAQRDSDTIYSVIRGWGVNQDGKTNGITAPNPDAQARLQRDVYTRFGIDPASIGLIEAHGTGTKLGDPIEVQALKESFGANQGKTAYCALGSVKSNIGHCLTAAGATGFIKLVQALRYRQLPPTVHFRQLNEHIQIDGSPFYVNDRLTAWADGDKPRLAAVSSFGFSGTNAHIVLEEYQAVHQVRLPEQDGKLIVPLSAKSAEQLRQRAADLLELLTTEGASLELADIAYTLQTGRVAMEERICFMAASIDELAGKLRGFLAGQRDSGSFAGQARSNKGQADLISQDADVKESVIMTLLSKRQYTKLAQLWSKGVDWDWSRLYGAAKPRRIALPVYPFAKARYWIEGTVEVPQAGAMASGAALHPLVQVNVSNLSGQRYLTNLHGTELFLADHRVRLPSGAVEKVLPGVAYLEMARAAIMDAVDDEAGVPELRDIVWLRPLAVTAATKVYISLTPAAHAQHGEEIEFQVYSRQDGQDVIHCEGRSVFNAQPAPARVDLGAIKASADQAKRESREIYATFEDMGLFYGPAHRGIESLSGDQQQLLAQLALPPVVMGQRHFYTLHPSMLDSALQALVGLSEPGHGLPQTPLVPFALGSLRIYGSCGARMNAWVRRAQGSSADGMATEVDIDLCDDDGNVCVQMRGFTCRMVGEDVEALQSTQSTGAASAADVAVGDLAFDGKFYESLIERIANKELTIEAAVKLG